MPDASEAWRVPVWKRGASRASWILVSGSEPASGQRGSSEPASDL